MDFAGCLLLFPAGAIILEKTIGFVLPCKDHYRVISSFPAREKKNHTQFVLGGFPGPKRGIFSKLSRSVETCLFLERRFSEQWGWDGSDTTACGLVSYGKCLVFHGKCLLDLGGSRTQVSKCFQEIAI